jgi:hypothetical protein
MTAVTLFQTRTEANAWMITHHAELRSRAHAKFRHLDPERREDAVAEVLAMALVWAHAAARRGTLHRLTPFWAVVFAARQWRTGRRCAGSSSTCVLSDAARIKHGLTIISLEALDEDADDDILVKFKESLADRDAEDPFEVVRRAADYPAIFEMKEMSPKARRTFAFLAETKSEGRQLVLAAELKVSPGRITQLKGELGAALKRHGYTGPLGPRPGGA